MLSTVLSSFSDVCWEMMRAGGIDVDSSCARSLSTSALGRELAGNGCTDLPAWAIPGGGLLSWGSPSSCIIAVAINALPEGKEDGLVGAAGSDLLPNAVAGVTLNVATELIAEVVEISSAA